jgi:hypothetical protein
MKEYIGLGVVVIIVVAVSLIFSKRRFGQDNNTAEIENLKAENRTLKERVLELEDILDKSENGATVINMMDSFFQAEDIEDIQPLVREETYDEEYNTLHIGNSHIEWFWNVKNTALTDFSFDGDEKIVLDYQLEFESKEQPDITDDIKLSIY